jgi:hypothetical protein
VASGATLSTAKTLVGLFEAGGLDSIWAKEISIDNRVTHSLKFSPNGSKLALHFNSPSF